MARPCHGDPEVPWDDEETTVEVIEVKPDEILCAFVVTCPAPLQDAASKFWTDTIADMAAQRMMKFIRNHHGD